GDTPYMCDAKWGFAARFDHVAFVRGQLPDPQAPAAPVPSLAAQHAVLAAKRVAPDERARWASYVAAWASDERPFSERVVDKAIAAASARPAVLWCDLFDSHEPWLARDPASRARAVVADVVLPNTRAKLLPREADVGALREAYEAQAAETLAA